MTLHLLAEIALAVLTVFVASIFWQLVKRKSYLRQAVGNKAILDACISHDVLVNPPARLEPYFEKNEIGYFVNIDSVVKADQASQQRIKIVAVVILILVFIGSFYLGYQYLAINVALLLLLGFSRISESAKANALEQILTIAIILHRWRIENPVECDEWVGKADTLKELYGTVKGVG